MRFLPGLIIATLATLAGCETRPPEPTSTQVTSPATEPGPSTTAAVAHAASTATPKSSCVKPTPDKPVREVKGPVPDPNCPEDDWPKFELPLGTVHFPEVKDGDHALEVAVEIAEKGKEREKGLMFRKNMREDAGMLFIFEEQRDLAFWMENTCIPLDMIFIDRDGTIVGIEENTPTLSRDTFDPGCPAKYVLEVNAGWARRHGVRAGMTMTLPRS